MHASVVSSWAPVVRLRAARLKVPDCPGQRTLDRRRMTDFISVIDSLPQLDTFN